MNHLQVFSHLYFGTNIFHSTFLKNICRFGNFITACMQKTQNKSGHSPSTRENILIFHQNPLQHPISALSASHVIIYCEAHLPSNSLQTSYSFARYDTGVVIYSESHVSCTCKTGFMFASLVVPVHTGCSAFAFCTPTKPLIRLNIRYKIIS